MNKAILAAAWIGLGALAASAQPGPGGPGGRDEQRFERPQRGRLEALLNNPEAAKKLGLTDNQIASLQARLDESKKQLIKLRTDVELAELEVRRLMRANNPDRAAVMKAVEAASAAQLALRKAMVDERLAVREIVGPEIAEKVRRHFNHCRAERRERMDGERPHRKAPRGPFPNDPNDQA